MKWTTVIHKIWMGLRIRCPNCEKGHMFSGLFTINETCPNCDVRFERREGESIGGTMINLVVAEVLSIGGFFISEALFHPPTAVQLTFWVLFNIVFILLFYRHARGAWVGVAYLTGGVYVDAPSNEIKP